MPKKAIKKYSLEDYISGVTLEEFEQAQKKQAETKVFINEDSETALSFNLMREMAKKYNEVFDNNYQSKKYLYYKRLDDLVVKAKNGDQDATEEILAYALHNWQPHAMQERFNIWKENTDEDDLTQAIAVSVLSAIRTFKFEDDCFKNFAGYLKSWVIGDLKALQINSAPIKILNSRLEKDFNGEIIQTENGQERKITYVYFDGFRDENGELSASVDIKDSVDDYQAFEDRESDKEFIENLKKMPDKIGEVLITYYGIATPKDSKKTLQATADMLGLSVKQVRSRLAKGQKILKDLYPQYSDEEYDAENAKKTMAS